MAIYNSYVLAYVVKKLGIDRCVLSVFVFSCTSFLSWYFISFLDLESIKLSLDDVELPPQVRLAELTELQNASLADLQLWLS